MSIEVKGITKKYGEQLAVDDVSFSVDSGEVVGFIGPNGAGKSTSMKIITGILRPDQGSVNICGMPALEKQLAIRRIIGYLPEHNPLYLDMYIREYLDYVAGLYGTKRKTDEIIALTGLGPEAHKKIGKLSKGYRQRVGLAQALIHDPEILILDEPTTGLDPNQLAEIRKLISEIGKRKTILLSTHILQEVEAICDRVIIINKGKIVADDRSAELRDQQSGTSRTIMVELSLPARAEIWKRIPGIAQVKSVGERTYLLQSDEKRDLREEIFKFAVSQDLTILSMSLKEMSLEEVFRDITHS